MLYTEFQKKSKQCPFCTRDHNHMIVEYETAFLTYALAPYHKHHLLVIPKRHVETFLKLDAEEYEEISALLRFGVKALRLLKYTDYSMLVRDGEASGKSVPHLHYHIIPHIRIGDVDHDGNQRRVITPAEVKEVIGDIKRAEKTLKNRQRT